MFRNSEGERIFMNEVKLLSPPPWRFLAVNEKCKSRQPKQKARVISSNGNLERFCLIWAIDYATFYCLNHVNEPSRLLRKSLSTGAVSGTTQNATWFRHPSTCNRRTQLQCASHAKAATSSFARNGRERCNKNKINVNKHEVRNECFRESASTSCC